MCRVVRIDATGIPKVAVIVTQDGWGRGNQDLVSGLGLTPLRNLQLPAQLWPWLIDTERILSVLAPQRDGPNAVGARSTLIGRRLGIFGMGKENHERESAPCTGEIEGSIAPRSR